MAVTAFAALMATEQLPVPVQAPLQPAKTEPKLGVDINVTFAPLGNGLFEELFGCHGKLRLLSGGL